MTKPVPEGFHTLTPHITVRDAKAAVELYERAFGAESVLCHDMEGKVMHAEVRIGDSVLMLNDEFPEQGVLSPPEKGGGVRLHLYVEDADAVFDRAVKAGLQPIMPVMDMFWGDRYGMLKDPFGHQWAIATHVEDVPPEELAERGKKAMAEMGG